MDWDTNVQTYLELFAAGFPEELRPGSCPLCHWDGFQQKHAHFTRSLQTLSELITVTIHRFLCSSCKDTHSVLPSFFRPKHTIANEVQELVMARLDSGVSLNAAGEEICSGVSIDKKTVRRWKHFWNKMMEEEENGLLEQTLTFVPAIVLPVGEAKKAVAGSLFQWLSYVWRQGSGSIPHFESVGLFTRLLRLHSSLSLAVVP